MNIKVERRQAARGQGALDGAEQRLLAALAEEGSYAFADPADPDGLIVRRDRKGVSLASGNHRRLAADALCRADLARRDEGARGRLAITLAGRAHLARATAPAEAAFLAQHLDLVADPPTRDGAPGTLRNAGESPLAWMACRRGRDGQPLIDASAFAAGERLRRDLTLALMVPSLSRDWTAPKVDGSGARDPAAASDMGIAAQQRVRRALLAVGSDLANLLIDLCGNLKGLEVIEAERRWPARSAKVVARIALGRLAEHYGLQSEAVGPERARARAWRRQA